MKIQLVDACPIRIYMAGNVLTANQVIAEYCYEKGFCVTLTKTDFIYTGGQESGFVIGIENYPRFPSNRRALMDHAHALVKLLMSRLNQRSALVVNPLSSHWLTEDPPGMTKKDGDR